MKSIRVPDALFDELKELAVAEYKDVSVLATNVLSKFIMEKENEWGESKFEEAFTK